MASKKKKRLTRKDLIKKGVPLVLIPGIVWAAVFGLDALEKTKNYYQSKIIFPSAGVVEEIEDGDTFALASGVRIRLIGVNAPDRGSKNYQEAKDFLESLVKDQKVYLEYDRYQDDKYGRILAWVWVDCEQKPKFEGPNYMYLSGNKSKPGLMENPKGCQKGSLVNEETVKAGLAKLAVYQGRGLLKYQQRINPLN